MERQAREYAEQQLNVSQQRQAHLEAEIKQERLVTAESSAAAASMAAELEHARQTIADQLAALDVAAFKVRSVSSFASLMMTCISGFCCDCCCFYPCCVVTAVLGTLCASAVGVKSLPSTIFLNTQMIEVQSDVDL